VGHPELSGEYDELESDKQAICDRDCKDDPTKGINDRHILSTL
jgi:hypothetical protein